MATLFGKDKTLTRDGVGQVVNGFTPNPQLTNGVLPISLISGESYTLNTPDWTVIRFRSTQNLLITLYDELDNESMIFPESPNLPIVYILSHVVSIKFYNDSGNTNTIYYQAS